MKKRIIISGLFCSTVAASVFTFGTFNENSGSEIKETAQASTLQKLDNSDEAKRNIQNLMLNSIDYFTNAKGNFEYLSSSGGYHLSVDYQVDLSDEAKSYEKSEEITQNNYQSMKMKTSNTQEISVYDGEAITVYKSDDMKYKAASVQPTVESIEVGSVSESERNELADSTMEDRVSELDGEKVYIPRVDPAYMGIAKTSLFPEDLAMGLLENKDQWNITREDKVAGVNVIVLEGLLNNDYAQRYQADKFELSVDPETGILLKMVITDLSGKVKERILTKNITLDHKLDSRLFVAPN